MNVDDLLDHLKQHWPQLIDGCYKPKPVRRVEIPKPDGRRRKLGIQTVLDRFIQQAIAQVDQPLSKSGNPDKWRNTIQYRRRASGGVVVTGTLEHCVEPVGLGARTLGAPFRSLC